jgi:hypothetical protein
MAVVVTADLPGGTAEQDQAMQRQLNLAQNPAPGVVMRLAGPTSGGWRVMSIWESQDAFDRFRKERLEPAFKEAGVTPPQFQFWTAESMFTPPR